MIDIDNLPTVPPGFLECCRELRNPPPPRPLCACGCGQRAWLVADVLVDGEHDCRQPWASTLHARGACDDESRVEVSVVVSAQDLPAVIAAGPCWCGLRETTVMDWCPRHGNVAAPACDPQDRSLAATQPMAAITEDEAADDLAQRARIVNIRAVALRYLERRTFGPQLDARPDALAEYDRQARVGRDLDQRLTVVRECAR